MNRHTRTAIVAAILTSTHVATADDTGSLTKVPLSEGLLVSAAGNDGLQAPWTHPALASALDDLHAHWGSLLENFVPRQCSEAHAAQQTLTCDHLASQPAAGFVGPPSPRAYAESLCDCMTEAFDHHCGPPNDICDQRSDFCSATAGFVTNVCGPG